MHKNFVLIINRDISNFHLIDIGLKGTDKISLENGTVTFSALKFTSTSYNNDVKKKIFFFIKKKKFNVIKIKA